MAKPTDFFVGITDLFSIILPGTALTYVCILVEKGLHLDVLGLLGLTSTNPNAGYVAFFVVSYLIGHGMDMAGAQILDPLYDLTYADAKRRGDLGLTTWLKKSPKRIVEALRKKWKEFNHGKDKKKRKSRKAIPSSPGPTPSPHR